MSSKRDKAHPKEVTMLDMIVRVRSLEGQLFEARSKLRLATPWPLERIADVLAGAADRLLTVHDYDGHGHEEIRAALEALRERGGS